MVSNEPRYRTENGKLARRPCVLPVVSQHMVAPVINSERKQ